MGLRLKTFSIFLIATLCFIVIVGEGTGKLILTWFKELESESISQQIKLVEQAMQSQLNGLGYKTADWANWDESYNFTLEKNPSFLKTNVNAPAVKLLGVQQILWFNNQSKLVHSVSLSANDQLIESLDSFLLRPQFNEALSQSLTGVTNRGFIRHEGAVYMIVVTPVMHSDLSGPPAGAIAFLRLLDEEFIRTVGQQIQLDLSLVTAVTEKTANKQTADSLVQIRLVNDETAVGLRYFSDIFGRPAFAVQLTVPRTTYQKGVWALQASYMICGLIGICFALSVIYLLEKLVVKRVTQLSSTVEEITKSGDLTTKITINGKDEIGRLGRIMQEMLLRLHHIQLSAEEARTNAEAADAAKSRFVANVSHELRTPLSGILGMTQVLLDSEVSLTKREHLSLVKESASQLLDVINDILDFSKLGAGKLALSLGETRLDHVFQEALNAIAVRAQDKGLALLVDCAADLPINVRTDSAKLRQILINLLGNAVKFTDHGEIVLSAKLLHVMGSKVIIKITVTDTGIGIPHSKQQSIFDPFVQADQSVRRTQQGTGLGLSITKQLVELLGGKIELKSRPGKGSVFSFTLEGEAIGDKTYYPAVDCAVFASQSAALLMKNKRGRKIAEEALKAHGVVSIQNCSDVESLRQAINNGANLIIADGDFAEEQTLSELTPLIQDPSKPTFVLLFSQQKLIFGERFLDAGAAATVGKPVIPRKVIKLLDRLLRGESISDDLNHHQQLPALEPLSILIADDTKTSLAYLRIFFERLGHKVATAENGMSVLEQLGVIPGDEPHFVFDLVLMDVQMPVMDGLTATRVIRNFEKDWSLPRLPIIAVTAHVLSTEHTMIFELGADAVVTKPVDPKHLFSAIATLLPQKKSTKETPAPQQRNVGQTEQLVKLVEALRLALGLPDSIFDVQDLLSRFNQDASAADAIIAIFLEEGPQLLRALEQAWRNGDQVEVRKAAHSLKGSLSNVGATLASEEASKLETAAHENKAEQAQFEIVDNLVVQTVTLLKKVIR